MKLTSTKFTHEGKIPAKYACDGLNISPPLTISEVPKNAQSLVLIMDDPDIPDNIKKQFKIETWDHWTVYNISPHTTTITEGQNPPGLIGKNTRGNLSYSGPCPPNGEHRYFFKLYALNTALNLAKGATKKEVEHAMKEHIIEQTILIGKYAR